MIRVGINARALAKPDPAGVSRYTQALLCALADRSSASVNPKFEYLLFGLRTLPDELVKYDCVQNAGEPATAHSGVRAHYWEQFVLPRVLGNYDLDVFHTPAGQPPVASGSEPFDSSKPALVTTIHDVSPISHPEWFSRPYATTYRVLTPLAVRASERLITVSEFARREITTTYPSAAGKITAIHNGVTPPADPGKAVERLRAGKFLFFIGAANQRKNVGGLLRAYHEYRTRVPEPVDLALAGPERDVFADREYEVPDGVRALGYVSDDQLGWLYRNAAAFCFPSLYEGFGLPIIEAMHAGTPVVTADRGAMAEVAGDAALVVDPLDTEALAEGIERVLADDARRQRLVRHGHERAASFTWERAAARTAEVYRAVANGAGGESAEQVRITQQ